MLTLECSNLPFFGGFNSSASSSFSKNDTSGKFETRYVDGSKFQGFYGQDSVSIGAASLSSVNMAVAQNTTTSLPLNGILGIGFSSSEARVVQGNMTAYPNFVEQLKAQNIISTKLYSVWLNDQSTFNAVNSLSNASSANWILSVCRWLYYIWRNRYRKIPRATINPSYAPLSENQQDKGLPSSLDIPNIIRRLSRSKLTFCRYWSRA